MYNRLAHYRPSNYSACDCSEWFKASLHKTFPLLLSHWSLRRDFYVLEYMLREAISLLRQQSSTLYTLWWLCQCLFQPSWNLTDFSFYIILQVYRSPHLKQCKVLFVLGSSQAPMHHLSTQSQTYSHMFANWGFPFKRSILSLILWMF